jgi:YHS domain-containing protein
MTRKLPAISVAIAALLLPILIACNQRPKDGENHLSPAIESKKAVRPRFTQNEVDNQIDPSCMMPLIAGIGDTLHYRGYVLGFCSKECKDDFFKDPVANLRLAKIRKILTVSRP